MKKDNSTLQDKVALRKAALRRFAGEPVILETHGGKGRLYLDCYSHVPSGLVIEKDDHKVDILARQRPTWRVYQGESVALIAAGAGSDLPINLVDIDPYGNPWPTIDAFLLSDRERTKEVHLVVNDGLRQKVQRDGSWVVESLKDAVSRWGNDLFPIYVDVCKWMMREKAAHAGYRLSAWAGYYCGYNGQMTHYHAVLKRS